MLLNSDVRLEFADFRFILNISSSSCDLVTNSLSAILALRAETNNRITKTKKIMAVQICNASCKFQEISFNHVVSNRREIEKKE